MESIPEISVQLKSIRQKAEQLNRIIEELKIENKALRLSKKELVTKVENQNDLIESLKEKKSNIVIANTVKQREGISDVKERIDELVREIDASIELLNK